MDLIFEEVEKQNENNIEILQSLSDDSKTSIEDFLRRVWIDEGDFTPESLSKSLKDVTGLISGLRKRLKTVKDIDSHDQIASMIESIPATISVRNAIFLKVRIENQICIANQLQVFGNALFTSFDAACIAQYDELTDVDGSVSSENKEYVLGLIDELDKDSSKDSDLSLLFAMFSLISVADLESKYPAEYTSLMKFVNRDMFTYDKQALSNILITSKDFKNTANDILEVAELPPKLKTSIRNIIIENYQDWLNTSSETYEQSIRRKLVENVYQKEGIQQILTDSNATYDRMVAQRKTLYATRINLAINEGIYSGFVYKGIHYCKFIAILDNKTSTMCKDMNNRIIPIKDILPGINAPPLHYHCRSTLIYISDEEAFRSDSSLL